MPMPLLLPFFQGLKPECAMGWDGEKEDGTLAVFRFEKILIFLDLFIGGREVTKKIKEKEGKKEGRESCVENNFDTRKIETRL